jgi:hypothetical protein
MRIFATKTIALAAVAAAVALTAVAGPATAARQINPPSNLNCGKYPAKISISPPRVWANYRTEQVLWFSQIQRWNSSTKTWYAYGPQYQMWSSFTYSGMSMTSWIPSRNSGLAYYANSTLNLPVKYVGYYRVASVVNGMQGGARWAGFVGGKGNHCYVR